MWGGKSSFEKGRPTRISQITFFLNLRMILNRIKEPLSISPLNFLYTWPEALGSNWGLKDFCRTQLPVWHLQLLLMSCKGRILLWVQLPAQGKSSSLLSNISDVMVVCDSEALLSTRVRVCWSGAAGHKLANRWHSAMSSVDETREACTVLPF